MASNLTITVDDEALRRARMRALSQGTSVNALLRDYLHAYAGVDNVSRDAVRDVLRIAAESSSGGGGERWTREDLHDRDSLKFDRTP